MKHPDPPSGHIAPEELAAITEPDAGLPPEWFSAHLAKCRYCMSIYAEFARARAESLTAAMPNAADHRLIAAAMDIPAGTVGNRAASPLARRRRTMVAAAVAAGFALAAIATGTWMQSRSTATAPVAITGNSSRPAHLDFLLYSDDDVPRATGLRGSFQEVGHDSLPRTYDTNPSSSDATYNRVVEFLRAGRGRDAEPFLREAVLGFPGEARFHNLAAILAYKNNDLARAESELRAARSLADDSHVLVNLATVLIEQGHLPEANALLIEVVERDPEAPIADLARSRATISIPPRLER